MAAMRANAHGILARVSPPLLLMVSCAIAGAGLFWLSHAAGPVQTVAAALVFAVGIAVVWPTMMGFVAERAPKTGALGLGLMAAAGSLAVGVVTTPLLGEIADAHLTDTLSRPAVIALAGATLLRPAQEPPELRAAARSVAEAGGGLPTPATGDFLRRAAAGEAGPELATQASAMLDAAENRSGLLSFRSLVPFAGFVCLVFAAIVLLDRRAGGYRAQVDRARLEPSR
jgi:MFS family permease